MNGNGKNGNGRKTAVLKVKAGVTTIGTATTDVAMILLTAAEDTALTRTIDEASNAVETRAIGQRCRLIFPRICGEPGRYWTTTESVSSFTIGIWTNVAAAVLHAALVCFTLPLQGTY